MVNPIAAAATHTKLENARARAEMHFTAGGGWDGDGGPGMGSEARQTEQRGALDGGGAPRHAQAAPGGQ